MNSSAAYKYLLIFCLTLWMGPLRSQPTITNILILYSDDQSYNTINAWGNKQIRTPNLDKLVAQGLSFRQTHVMGGHQGAVCIPSRAMLMTGRYVTRLPMDGATIPDSLVSLPEVLRAKGYTTFHTGKWHSDKASHHRMFSAGDNIFFGGMHFEKDGGQFHPTVFHYDSTGRYEAGRSWVSDTFSSQLYADAAVRFLQSDQAKQQPFLCYVAFTSPHDPRTPPTAFANAYNASDIALPPNFLPEHPFDNGDLRVRDEMLIPHPRTPVAVKKEIANYYAMISEMDAQVGRIMQALGQSKLRENTLVIFAGDNGLAVGQHGLLGKQSLYEHSIRVPMIMAGPGIPANTSTHAFTYLSDIAPTVYDLLGLQQPSSVEAMSLLPVIQRPSQNVRSTMYNVYGHWSRSIKTKDGYKLIVYNVNGKATTQLFNLQKDKWETKNLADAPAYQERVKTMLQLLRTQMKATHDDLDIDLPDWGRRDGQKSSGS